MIDIWTAIVAERADGDVSREGNLFSNHLVRSFRVGVPATAGSAPGVNMAKAFPDALGKYGMTAVPINIQDIAKCATPKTPVLVTRLPTPASPFYHALLILQSNGATMNIYDPSTGRNWPNTAASMVPISQNNIFQIKAK
jgi:hypothetical protein